MPALSARRRRDTANGVSLKPRSLSASSSSSLLTDVAARIRLRSGLLHPPPTLGTRNPQDLDIAAPPSSHSNLLTPRQQYLPPIPEEYQGLNGGPAPGTIVGIVFGTVLGFLLLFWLIVAVVSNRANAQYVEGDDTEFVVRRSDRHHSSRRSRHTRTRRSRSDASDDRSRRQSSPRRPRTERIIVTETRRTESRAPRAPSQPSVVQERESIHIREQSRNSRRVEGDDVVEVIEEHSDISEQPPRRKKSGYRTVDPNQYAGGNYPQRDLYGDRSRSKRYR